MYAHASDVVVRLLESVLASYNRALAFIVYAASAVVTVCKYFTQFVLRQTFVHQFGTCSALINPVVHYGIQQATGATADGLTR
jgi:hypothetical protein